MRITGFAIAGLLLGNSLFAQAPAVTKLANIYSWTPAGLPNYGIARGSIFAIFGTNLAGTTIPLQPAPLQTTLGGVSLTVTVNGANTQPLLYYVSPTQINAVLPSATPAGTGTITVNNGSASSAPFTIQVAESAFGLLTFNYGSGQLAGFDANNSYAYLGYSAAANPGDILELWGTGLGPVADDNAGGPVSDAVEVDIGGIPANVLYHGRSSYTGLDQINVQVPAGVSGCNVSVNVVTGNYVSNFATLPVATSGRTCSDGANLLPASVLQQIAAGGQLTSGLLILGTSIPATGTNSAATISTYTGAIFIGEPASQLNPGNYPSVTSQDVSIGSCLVYVSTAPSTTPPASQAKLLNAGSNITVSDGSGSVALSYDGGNYDLPDDSTFIANPGDTVSFNNGAGGPDVGPFNTQIQMPTPTVWTNAPSITSVNRSAGVTVTWTPGGADTFVAIEGLSGGVVSDSDPQVILAGFGCLAQAASGQFTVPPAVLMSMPPASEFSVSYSGGLELFNAQSALFNAPGLDFGVVLAALDQYLTLNYQ